MSDPGASASDVYGAFPFAEAIDFLRAKDNVGTRRWAETLHAAHNRAFVVAGAMKEELVADLRGAVDDVIAKGTSLSEFRKSFDAIVAARGWTGWTGSEGGEARRMWRVRTIYETNLASAYAAGRLKQMRARAEFAPYWQYRHAYYRRPTSPRERHQSFDGLILRHDDPFWEIYYPPNGWRCSCGVRTLTAGQLKRTGREGPDSAPAIEYRTVRDPLTGEAVRYPAGADYGWAYQPGDVWDRGVEPRWPAEPIAPPATRDGAVPALDGRRLAGALVRLDPRTPLPPLSAARPFIQPLLPDDIDGETAIGRFLDLFGAGAAPDGATVFIDKVGDPVLISRRLFEQRRYAKDGSVRTTPKVHKRGRAAHLLRLAEALMDPDEIWLAPGKDGRGKPRRFFVRTAPDGGGMAVFEYSADGWNGLTAFPPASPTTIEDYRIGVRLYSRPE